MKLSLQVIGVLPDDNIMVAPDPSATSPDPFVVGSIVSPLLWVTTGPLGSYSNNLVKGTLSAINMGNNVGGAYNILGILVRI